MEVRKVVEITGRELKKGDYVLANLNYRVNYGTNFPSSIVCQYIDENTLLVNDNINTKYNEKEIYDLLNITLNNKKLYCYKLGNKVDYSKYLVANVNIHKDYKNITKFHELYGMQLSMGDLVIYDMTTQGAKYGLVVGEAKVYTLERGVISLYCGFKLENYNDSMEVNAYRSLLSSYQHLMQSNIQDKTVQIGDLFTNNTQTQSYIYLGKFKLKVVGGSFPNTQVLYDDNDYGYSDYHKFFDYFIKENDSKEFDLYFYYNTHNGYGRTLYSILNSTHSLPYNVFEHSFYHFKNNIMEGKKCKLLRTKLPNKSYTRLYSVDNIEWVNHRFSIILKDTIKLDFIPV